MAVKRNESAAETIVGPVLVTIVRPLQAFFRLEAASGLVLLGCALAAFAWANLGGAETYRSLLATPVTLAFGGVTTRFSLAALVNDGLMTVFFFLVGMEIKRELAVGELRTPARAALPGIAALGGMIVPASVYVALNRGGEGSAGWAIPMATDIAFCIAILTLLKGRVPHPLIVFVTALAIFDDVGGILVIALFYGKGVHLSWLAIAAGITGVLVVMGRAYVRSGLAYAVAGALLWYALHHGGIHATIAGVVLGLAVPARPRKEARAALNRIAENVEGFSRRPQEDLEGAVLEVEREAEQAEAPITRFIHALHPWVAFGVMPIFAFANSGVDLSGLEADQLTGGIALGAGLGLVVGKPVGIFLATAAAVKMGVSPAPGRVSWPKVLGASMIAGIGFTVALFIAGLAFGGSAKLLDEAKLGILAGSLVSGLAGAALLRMTRPVASGAAAPDLPGGDTVARPA